MKTTMKTEMKTEMKPEMKPEMSAVAGNGVEMGAENTAVDGKAVGEGAEMDAAVGEGVGEAVGEAVGEGAEMDAAAGKRVVYITSQFPVPSETFAAGDIRELRRRGVDVRVYGYRPDRKDHERLLKERGLSDLKVENCGLERQVEGLLQALIHPWVTFSLKLWIFRHERARRKKLFRALALIPAFMYMYRGLRSDPPDLVHLFWGQYTSILGYLLKRKMPELHISMFLGAHDLEAGLGISKDAALRADSLFTHAYANLPALKRMGIPPEKVRVIHRGVDTEWVDAKLSQLNSSLGAAGGDEKSREVSQQIVSAGRLQTYKGFDDVIRVFAALREKHPGLKLTILGEGPDRERLERLSRELGLGEAVSLPGHKAHEEVLEYMARAKIFLFMSKHDGERLPNSVKEAMLCGCVCITTKTPGIEELVDDGRTGFVVPQGDVSAAVSRGEKVLAAANRDLLAAARKEILERFSIREAMGRYLEAWFPAGTSSVSRASQASQASRASHAERASKESQELQKLQLSGAVTSAEGPTVSVVTALYNASAYIAETIASVQAQTFTDWEMIIVDDCSSDESASIAAGYADEDERIRLIRLQRNSGPAVARNTAIEAAAGRYIAFLDSDDCWLPEKLERQLRFMQEHDYSFTHTWFEKHDEKGESLGIVMQPPEKISYRKLLKSNRIGCLTVIYDAQRLGKVYMPLIRKRQDYGLWLELLRNGGIARCLKENLACYRVHTESISQNKLEMVKYNWMLYHRVEKLSLLRSAWYLMHVIIRKILYG